MERIARLVTILLSGVVLAACGATNSSSTTTTTTVSPVNSGAERPLDVGWVRVRAPLNWRVIVEPTPCRGGPAGAPCHEPPCAPGGVGIHISSALPSLHCKEIIKGPFNSVWISNWQGSWRGGFYPIRQPVPGWHGRSVVISAPRAGLIIYGFGAQGVAVAESYGPSTLARLSAAKLPVSTPRGWRAVRFGNVEASVPRSWTVRDLSRGSWLNPGDCGFAPFYPAMNNPIAYVGSSKFTPSCPIGPVNAGWTQRSLPADGLWLASSVPIDGSPMPPFNGLLQPTYGSIQGRSHEQHGVTVEVLYPVGSQPAGSVSFIVFSGGQETHGLLGLGVDAATAEQVLSSIRPL